MLLEEHEQHAEREVTVEDPLGPEPQHDGGRDHARDVDQGTEARLDPHRVEAGGQAHLGETPEPRRERSSSRVKAWISWIDDRLSVAEDATTPSARAPRRPRGAAAAASGG